MGTRFTVFRILAAAWLTCAVCASCSDDGMGEGEGIEPVTTEPIAAEPLTGEEAAVATFNEFMDIFLTSKSEQGETRSTTSRPRVSGVRSTNTVAYGEPFSATRSTEDGIPVYELTLQSDDSTEGFAVVVGEDDLQNVVAYVPNGAISDTTYNAGLVMWFREMYAMGREKQSEPETRADDNVWQRNWDTSPLNYIHGSDQWYRAFTEAERSSGSWSNFTRYGPVDYAIQKKPLMTSLWNQTSPYNRRVTTYYTDSNGLTQKNRVGCFAVAIGQIMNYHKHPANYDWSSLKNSSSIFSTKHDAEVSRLLINIATVGGTTFTSTGAGSTTTRNGSTYVGLFRI